MAGTSQKPYNNVSPTPEARVNDICKCLLCLLYTSVREGIHLGVNIHGEKVDMLRFADDIAVTAESNEDLQKILDTMDQVMKNEINEQKAKVLEGRRRCV